MCLLGMSFLLDLDPSFVMLDLFHSWFILYEFLCGALTHLQGFCHLLLLSNCCDTQKSFL